MYEDNTIPAGTKLIPLTQGKFAIVDAEDYDHLMQFKWRVATNDGFVYYATRTAGGRKDRKSIHMHRLLMNCISDKSIVIDHIDNNGLNNCKINLRRATQMQNCQNGRIRKRNRVGYKGVTHELRGNVTYFRTRITVNKKPISLGYFKTLEEAALAYNEAAIKYFGEFANLNVIQE